jgi:hypothetical protein
VATTAKARFALMAVTDEYINVSVIHFAMDVKTVTSDMVRDTDFATEPIIAALKAQQSGTLLRSAG